MSGGSTVSPETSRPAVLRDLAADRAAALALIPVSRETEVRLDRFVGILLEWQQRMNLIAASTEATIWTRHVADSLQLLALAPQARTWIDLGSGAGFPGLVMACALADTAGAQVHLVESNAKKAAFLRAAAALIGVPAIVHGMRIENFGKSFRGRADVVTARAVAPLGKLLDLAYPLLKKGTLALFLKGQDVGTELTEAAKCWNLQARLVPSRTNPKACVVVIDGAALKAKKSRNRSKAM